MGGDGSLAPGSRTLAIVLIIGLIAVLIGRAIWADDGSSTSAAPGAVHGTFPKVADAGAPSAGTVSGESGSGSDINSLIASAGTDIQGCLRDAAGTPAPADERQTSNQAEFITILSGQLEQLRGLGFDHPVDAEFLPGPKLETRIGQLLDEEPQPQVEDTGAGGRLLAALGAIEPGDDPQMIERQALKGQVAGLYVPKTEELLVRSGKDIGITDTITVVHELDHALTDQALGGLQEDFGKGPDAGERSAAYSALAEGDATIVMEAYLLRYGSTNDQLDAVSELGPANKAQDDLETFPYYFQRQILYPYVEGLNFDCALFEKGDWDAVDKAYRDPPRTTAEVMFPERYGETPKHPPAPISPGPNWKKALKSEVGAADLDWLFSAPGDDQAKALEDPRAAASDWDGGQVTMWTRGAQSAVALSLRSRTSGYDLCRSIGEWYGAFGGEPHRDPQLTDEVRFRGDTSALLRCSKGGAVRLSIGPTANVIGRLFSYSGTFVQ
jgi:hypothetical protein